MRPNMTKEKELHKKNSILKRISRILLRTIFIIVLLIIALLIVIQTPPAQNFIVKKATAFLEKKLKTRVEIGRLYIGFPKNIVIENIYLEDQKKDTLLYGGSLKVDISMMKLLHHEVEVNDIKLNQITAKVNRVLPDTAFNFQFILDAFASKEKTPPPKADTSSLNINIKYVQLDKIRLVFKDVITGNDDDIFLQHFETNIDKFDLSHQRFDIPIVKIEGLKAKIYQSKPLVQPQPLAKDVADAGKPSSLLLNMRKVLLSDIALDYSNDVSAMYASLNLGKLDLNINKLDLRNQMVDLKDIELDKTLAAIRFGKKDAAAMVKKEAGQVVQAEAQAGWRITVGAIRLNENNLQFDDDNKPREKSGMDFGHLKANDLTLHVDNLLYSKDSISGSVRQGELKEQSGFQLTKWETDFLYANNESYLKNLILQTPGTELKKSLVLHYPSIDALKTNIGALQMDVDLVKSKIQVKDILTFVPGLKSQPAFANPNNTLLLNGKLKGSVSKLDVEGLQLQAFNDTKVKLHGSIDGLPDMKKLGANLVITEFSTSRRDILMLAPKGSIPASITIPESIKITGKITGGMNDLHPDLVINTTLGSISIKGSLRNPSDAKKSQYDVAVETRNLNLGTLLKNSQNFGTLSARFVAKGKGYDPKTANATISGVIQSAILKKYNYQNLQLTASIANQKLQAKASIHDPNIDISFDASGNMRDKYPAIKLTANIDSIKTLPLHLTTDSIIYRGQITGDFPVTDPDHLQGNLLILKSLLIKNSQRIELDTLQLSAGANGTGQFLNLTADAINLKMQGTYKLTQLGSVFQQAIQPYFAIMSDSAKTVKTDPYNFTFTGNLINKPILKGFLPALTRLETVSFDGKFSSTSGWQMNFLAPEIIYGANHIQKLQLQAGTKNNAVAIAAQVQLVTSGKSIALYNTTFNADIANNQVDFTLNIQDKASKNKYRFSSVFKQPKPGNYIISLKPQELLLNYAAWSVPGDNQISILKTDINARNFVITLDSQQLCINSLSQQPNSPMEVKFASFKIATLANFVASDSIPVDGTLNGKVVLNGLSKQLTFTSDLVVSDVSIKKDTIGNVNLKVNNTVANTYAADVKIDGHGNDVQLTGNYYVRPNDSSSFEMNLDIRKILLSTIEGATLGAIKNSSGMITGKFAVNGTPKAPSVNGHLDFKKAAFNLSMLNSYFKIEDESIKVDDKGVKFDTFTITDSSNNSAVLDGMLYYNPGYTDYRFDLTLKAKNFRALNTSKKDNKVYYGQLFFDSNLKIKGTQVQPVVDGAITINEQTKLTVVLPQKEPGVESRAGIVEFVDMDAKPNDSLFMAKYDSVNKSDMLGLDIAVNINVDKNAEFNLVVDEGNGDFLTVKGEAALTGGIDPSGKITLAGAYELEEGAYELSFNFLHRKFNIQKGSTIVWTGEPTKANINITAVYLANTAPLDLVQNEITSDNPNFYRQKLPFEVDLIMKGELLKPILSFDIVLPEDKNYSIDKSRISLIENKLALVREETEELNKQVFALLLLGRFISENPFATSSDGFSAEGFARSSVSQLLTEQLNKLASDLIKGVDINFDVASTNDDYSTGEKQARTDLNVALSKRLLNDRLTVTIGSSFELEGAQSSTAGAKSQTNNLAGNVSVDYKLSKDGRYALRAYRKNEYEGVLEGYIVETGIGFVLSVDYNKFKQIFLTKKQREQKRSIKKDIKKQDADDRKKEINTTNDTTTNE
jgi:translocation and assembly module TamB